MLLILYARFLTGICLLLSIILFQHLLEHVLLHNEPVEGNSPLHGCFPSGIFEQESVNASMDGSTTCSKTVDYTMLYLHCTISTMRILIQNLTINLDQ